MTPLALIALAAYAASFVLYVWLLFAPRRFSALAPVCLAAGIVLQFFVLMERARMAHAVPYHDLYGSLSLFAWLLALTYFGLEEFHHHHRSVGAFVLPFVLALFLAAQLPAAGAAAAPPALPPQVRGSAFALHVTLSVLAYAAFALSFVLSALFLLQDRLLRAHHLGNPFWRLPPLEILERMSRNSVRVGLAAMAAGIVFGAVWVDRLTGRIWATDLKYLVTLAIFAVYAAYLLLSRTAAWRGARASVLCVVNFVLVILSFTVVNVYLSRQHRFF
jgi:ABC-type transport system involved in cytochrome c biogenesis permease subunit